MSEEQDSVDFVGQRQSLTTRQRIEAAYQHYVLGIDQQKLAHVFRINSGRINEGCLAIWKAAEDPKNVRAYRERKVVISRKRKRGK